MDATTPKDTPKQELLIKLLKMSTSPNDGEALIAVRKANELLASAGWDWEKLVRGKIVVIADPFTSLGEPPTSTRHTASYAPASPRATTPARPTAPPPPPIPLPRGTPAAPISTRPNLYNGFCHCCGREVIAKAGAIYQMPSGAHGGSWTVICDTCNTSAQMSRYPAARVKTPRKKSVADLA